MASEIRTKLHQATDFETVDSAWKSLYKLGGACSLLMVVIILSQFIIFMTAPPPLEGTAGDWFALFQRDKFLGLLAFELLMVVYVVLSIPLALALYVALRKTDQSSAGIYLVLTLVGAISFIAARPAFEMLSLSEQHAAAATDSNTRINFAAAASQEN